MKLDSKNIEDIMDLTPMQQGLLFHHIKNIASNQYFEQLCIKINKKVDYLIFEKSWGIIVKNNEMLRTVFRWEEINKPIQIVLRNHKPNIKYIDYSKKDKREMAVLLADIRAQDKKHKFNLLDVPFRILLCKIDEENYEMIVSNHHILFDGWSLGIILEEFLKIYNHLVKGGREFELKKNKFKEFVEWVNNRNDEEYEIYWRHYLKGFDTKTELPIKKKMNKEINYSEEYKFIINRNTIDQFIKEHRITLATLIYGVWGILLQKYNNSDDIIFGTTVSGRNTGFDGIDNMVGLFINTLPIRIKTSKTDNIFDLLYRIKRDIDTRVLYEHTPLVNMKKYSDFEGKNDLFDSLVVIENYPLDIRILNQEDKLSFDSYSMDEVNNFDVSLSVMVFEEIEVCISYNKEAFEHQDICLLAKHINNILTDITKNPNKLIKDINILSKEETVEILSNFNNTGMDYQKDKTINCLFEEQVKRTPNNIAIVYGVKQLTYIELNESVNRLAKLLVEKGLTRNKLAGVMVENSIEMVVSILAILKAGGAYVPIDPKLPDLRKQYILQDCKVELLLTQKHLVINPNATLEKSSLKEVIYVDKIEEYAENIEVLTNRNKLSDLMYVIYTSGTTGTPKGVMVEHKNLVAYMQAFFEFYKVTSSDATIHLVPFSFDLFAEELFLALLKGGKFVIPKEDEFRDINKLRKIIVENNVSIISCSPALLNEFNKMQEMKSVHTFINGGDVLKLEYIDKLLKYSSVYNGYGPAETTIGATHYKVYRDDIESSISIGKPIKNYRAYILDKDKNLLPIGIPGELYIGGEGVARGYINKREITEEKFMDDPFFKNGKMYKTGDLVKWKNDGNIEFIGRIDEQVKIMGVRMELGEIEKKLLKHEEIQETVVVTNETRLGKKYLCAYIVSNINIQKNEMVKFLAKELPESMIPMKFINIDHIPLTRNGKIDRMMLSQQLVEMEEDAKREIILPRDEIEKRILNIWSEILEEDVTNINSDFFEIGGDSLTLTRVFTKINKEFSQTITIQDLFDNRSAIELADLIREKLGLIKESKFSNIDF